MTREGNNRGVAERGMSSLTFELVPVVEEGGGGGGKTSKSFKHIHPLFEDDVSVALPSIIFLPSHVIFKIEEIIVNKSVTGYK
jgi:hypothetical protein